MLVKWAAGMPDDRVPRGQLTANATLFRIGVIARNLFILLKHPALGESWLHHKAATVRWRPFHLPGKHF